MEQRKQLFDVISQEGSEELQSTSKAKFELIGQLSFVEAGTGEWKITITDKKEEGLVTTIMNMLDFFKPSEVTVIVVLSIILFYFLNHFFFNFLFMIRSSDAPERLFRSYCVFRKDMAERSVKLDDREKMTILQTTSNSTISVNELCRTCGINALKTTMWEVLNKSPNIVLLRMRKYSELTQTHKNERLRWAKIFMKCDWEKIRLLRFFKNKPINSLFRI
uniref:HTH_48 domain-containing protein n=1 Tax=Heterorhabditis bacteriophora TaxID=37862 RepID=A0A1I7WVC1_HETBA